ncbi:hypothetical protein TWF506_007360 [Arthrobotrys conoides]|uniref:Uncharacterized protein n=1 Tax=Arthrobotrys conoides TaxID=74498 RepID=A0AAN8NFK1_9PEZI
MYMASRHWQPGHLLLASTFFQYLQPVRGFFWIKAVTLPGEYNLDIDEFVTASTTFKPLSLTEWRDCVRDIQFSAEDYASLRESWCSFGASFSIQKNSWSIHTTTDPDKIDTHNPRWHSYDSFGSNLPKIERAIIGGDPRNYLSMGTSFPNNENLVRHEELRWKVYRPVEDETGRTETGLTTSVYIANARNPTFSEMYPKTYFESVSSLALPLDNTGIKKYIGDFLVTEVTTSHEQPYDDDALQEGDFLVLEGAREHIQVCFQEMTRRAYNDDTYRPDIRASYLELYSGRNPRRRWDIIGCVEVVLRVYKDLPTPRRNPNEPTVYVEQPLLVEKLPGYVGNRNRNTNGPMRVEDFDPNLMLPIAEFFSLFDLDEGRQEEMGMSPRFGGTESEIPSIPVSNEIPLNPVSNEIQQGIWDESLGTYLREQGGPYDESFQPEGPMAMRSPSFGPENFQSQNTDNPSVHILPTQTQERLLLDIFGEEDETGFDGTDIPDIFGDIEDLVNQLEPEPLQSMNANRGSMEIERDFEKGIWEGDLLDNPFQDLNSENGRLTDLSTKGDIQRWHQFWDKVQLPEDEDYLRGPYFTKEDEKPITEDLQFDLSLQEADEQESEEAEKKPEWRFPTTAEEKPRRLQPAQYAEVHNYYSNRAGDPKPGRGKWIDAQLMLRRLQLGKFDQVPNDIKYLLPGNPEIMFRDQDRGSQ